MEAAFSRMTYEELRHVRLFLLSSLEVDPSLGQEPLFLRAISEIETRLLFLRIKAPMTY